MCQQAFISAYHSRLMYRVCFLTDCIVKLSILCLHATLYPQRLRGKQLEFLNVKCPALLRPTICNDLAQWGKWDIFKCCYAVRFQNYQSAYHSHYLCEEFEQPASVS